MSEGSTLLGLPAVQASLQAICRRRSLGKCLLLAIRERSCSGGVDMQRLVGKLFGTPHLAGTLTGDMTLCRHAVIEGHQLWQKQTHKPLFFKRKEWWAVPAERWQATSQQEWKKLYASLLVYLFLSCCHVTIEHTMTMTFWCTGNMETPPTAENSCPFSERSHTDDHMSGSFLQYNCLWIC